MRYAGLIGAGIAELLHSSNWPRHVRGFFFSEGTMSKEQELIVDDTMEGRSTSIEVKYRIKFDYQPEEKATLFEPGCEESFSINSVAMQIRAGTWIDLSSAEYDDREMIQHILDAREQDRRDAELDRWLMSRHAA